LQHADRVVVGVENVVVVHAVFAGVVEDVLIHDINLP
jgi:hypothetical protein